MSEAWPTALVLHPDCGRHDTGWSHPEHQGRLPAIVHAIYRETPALLARVLQREGTPATRAQIARVHSPAHIDAVMATALEAERTGTSLRVDPDTVISGASLDAALAAAGCVLDAVTLVRSREAHTAFALSRPPGHHALPGRAMGFCLFNSVAIAARTLQHEHGVRRVLIVDWDVHHGNGTQDIFYDDPDVYYLSLHQADQYPGTGVESERGHGAGAGTTRNVVLSAGTPPSEYRRAYDDALAAAFAEFTPEFVLVSAGFDCMRGDPLGGLLLEPDDLHAMTVGLCARTRAAGAGGPVLTLEGGYAPERTAAGVLAVFRALAGLPPATV
ncbi:MAG TPA: histone deacetylase [Longimicrobiales bacterium]|nr:histone deacetylase [Longimicrobiales bacterium]